MKKIIFFIIINTYIFSSTKENNKFNIYILENLKTEIRTIEIRNIDNKLTVIGDLTSKSSKDSKGLKIEAYKPLLKVSKHNIYLGGGIKFGEPVEFNQNFSAMSYLSPLYFSTLYSYEDKNYDLFGKFNIGYELAFDNKKNVKPYDTDLIAEVQGGLHFELEGGIVYKNFILGLSYNQTSTKLEIPEGISQRKGKVDIDYTSYTLNLGYQFD